MMEMEMVNLIYIVYYYDDYTLFNERKISDIFNYMIENI